MLVVPHNSRALLAAISIGIVLACTLVAGYAAEDPKSLAAARTLWREMAVKRYSYVIKEHSNQLVICTGPDSNMFRLNEAKVVVKNGRVTKIASMTDFEFPASCLRSLGLYRRNLHTIEGLFEFIEREQMENGGSPRLEIVYDATFGFPASIRDRGALDASDYSVEDFRVLK